MFWGKVLYAAFFICYFHEFVQGALYDSQAAPYGKKQGKVLGRATVCLCQESGTLYDEVRQDYHGGVWHGKSSERGGYVMFPNHQGKYDALGIIYAHEKPCSFVMDKAKSNTFLVKEIVDVLDAKRLELDNVRQNLRIINEITDEVKQGKRFILFSEGGYGKNDNRVQQFKPGSFKSVMRAKAPLVPVALIDSYKAFNSFSFGRLTTKVIFLPAMYYEDYRGMKTPELASLVRRKIIDKMEEFGVVAE